MKRFHVHAHVRDLQASIAFYSKLFGADPARVEADYAQWMLEDPRLNFAISSRGHEPGLGHIGFQADTPAELAQLKANAEAAEGLVFDEGATSCCYARGEKHWVQDPAGLRWEQFHTTGQIATFSEPAPRAGGCCAPKAAATPACCAGMAE